MRNRRAWLGTVAIAGTLVLAACSSSSPSTPSTGAAAASLPASLPASIGGGVNPSSDFCTELKNEKVKSEELGKTIGAAVASKDFATTKKTLGAYFATVAQDIGQVEASMSSAPANVQAALGTVNQFFSQVQSAVAGANSMQELETSMAGIGSTPQLKAAGKTLDDYTKSQCGDISSPTP